jgi:hypothetical protein
MEGFPMGRMSYWAIDMEENMGAAIEAGATSLPDVIAYLKTNMPHVDERFVKEKYNEVMGEF